MADIRLLAAIDEELEEDLLLISCMNSNDDTETKTFILDDIPEELCRKMFRFEKDDIPILCQALRIPENIICENRTTCPGVEGLCLLLRRLAYPSRLSDLKSIFGRSETAMSVIINEVLDFIYSNHGHLLQDLNRTWLRPQCLNRFAMAVHAHDAPLPNCWGFIVGTVRPICRPTSNQRLVFNGHKRVHSLKFQSIVTPNGLVANMFGPLEGRRHDAGLLRESGLRNQLERHMQTPTGDIFVLYGDPAYPLSTYIVTPFRGGVLSANQARFNKKMSAVRTCVEWAFGKILNLFAFLDFKKNLKLFLQPVGNYYLVGTILVNCHSCLYGSETSMYFDVPAPTLADYLSG